MARLLLVVALILRISAVKSCYCERRGIHSHCKPGSDTICECDKGFESATAEKFKCTDIKECDNPKDNDCVEQSKCKDFDGGYKCECNGGGVFEGDGKISGSGCKDRNECNATVNPCGKGNGKCVNIVATKSSDLGYLCECSPGFATMFSDQVCAKQKCEFDPPTGKHVNMGACEKFFENETGIGKIHRSTEKAEISCEAACDDGYAKTNGIFSCTPNNPGGAKTKDLNGVVKGSISCAEQKCTIGNLDKFGLNSRKGNCTRPLNALTGARRCELECTDGFIKTAGGTLECSPNGDKPEGTLSGSVTCTGTPCGPLVVNNSNHFDGHNTNSTTLDTAQVVCNTGYVGGISTVVCSADGLYTSSWGSLPKCKPASCGPLKVKFSNHSAGKHSGVTTDSFVVGCSHGYKGNPATVTCTGDEGRPGVSRWVGMPTCEAVSCGSLSIPKGQISTKEPAKLKTMDTLKVTCENGYQLIGDSTATCSPKGPEKSAWVHPKCEPAKCPKLKIKNSDMEDGIEGKVDDKVSVICKGAAKASIVLCQAKGPGKAEWSAISCEGDATTPTPETVTDDKSPPDNTPMFAAVGGVGGGVLLVVIIIVIVVCV